MSAGRLVSLYAITGVEGPVLGSKQLYAGGDFQGSNMPVSATSGHSSKFVLAANAAMIRETFAQLNKKK